MILVAVANDQTTGLVLQRHAGVQLGLRADLQTEVEGLARIEDFLNHLAQLIHLDGKHPAVAALVLKLGDGVAEGVVQVGHPVPQDVLKTDEQWELKLSLASLLDDVRNLDGRPLFAQRCDHHVSIGVHVKVPRSPTVDVVERARSGDVPRGGGGNRDRFRFAHE